MDNKNNLLIWLCIILLGVGFAAIVVSLNINGNVMVSGNASDFQVIYDTTYVNGKGVAKVNGFLYNTDNPSYTSNTQMVFNPSKRLIVAGDYYEVSYKLLNKSTLYDSTVNIVCGSGSDANGSLDPFSYSGDVKDISISAQGSYEGTIRFTYLTTEDNDTNVAFTCKVTASALSRMSVAEKSNKSYYAFNNSISTEDTSDYSTLGHNVFLKLDSDGNKYVCMLSSGATEPFCIIGGTSLSLDEKFTLIQSEFGSGGTCNNNGTSASCYNAAFDCAAYSDGQVVCGDDVSGEGCYIYADGSVSCETD